MLKINKNSDKLIILLHEIYGINNNIKEIANSLSSNGFDLIAPDFNNNKVFDYKDEELAYLNYKNNVGFIKPLQKIENIIINNRKEYRKIVIIGFSVGATLAWLSSEMDLDLIIGLYGSRIRDYLNIKPKSKLVLYFAEEEKSFNPKELIKD